MGIDDLVAMILVIVFMFRRSDVRRQEPEMYRQVAGADFERWKHKALKAYNISSVACVLKLGLDLLFWHFYASRPFARPVVVMAVGGSIFVGWGIAVLVGVLKAKSARKLRIDLGIDLRAPAQ